MRLERFTVTNYRSITKAEKLDLTNFTVLVGANNEGKSNILRAMVLGMRVLEGAAHGVRMGGRSAPAAYRRALGHDEYDWERDYPLQRQAKSPLGKTSLRYDFRLTDDENEAFRHEVKSTITNDLPIRIQLSQESVQVEIPKKGPGQASLTKKRDAIARFIGSRIDVAHIPAVRQSGEAENAVRRLLDRELRQLEASEEYQQALARVSDLQQPILDVLGDSLSKTMQQFIPDVTSVGVSIDADSRYRALRQAVGITVDDGFATDLSTKGDGVQSLAAVALMRHLTSEIGGDREVVLAIEEPESHLHPNAIHQLRRVLHEIAERQQVVVTTHSPLFVNRSTPRENIIVQDSRAKPAASIEEIRATLGVRVADNLRSAHRVVVVEGDSDGRVLAALISHSLPALASLVENGELAIEALGGSGKLTYRLSRLQSDVCETFVIMDGDEAGRQAIEKAVSDGLVEQRSTFALQLPGRSQSELEDLIDPTIYMDVVESEMGIVLRGSRFTSQRSKWSERMAKAAAESGQPWTASTAAQAKTIIANAVAANPAAAIHSAAEAVVGNLLRRLARWTGTELAVSDPGTTASGPAAEELPER